MIILTWLQSNYDLLSGTHAGYSVIYCKTGKGVRQHDCATYAELLIHFAAEPDIVFQIEQIFKGDIECTTKINN